MSHCNVSLSRVLALAVLLLAGFSALAADALYKKWVWLLPYQSEKLNEMARELDPIFERIVRDAAGG